MILLWIVIVLLQEIKLVCQVVQVEQEVQQHLMALLLVGVVVEFTDYQIGDIVVMVVLVEKVVLVVVHFVIHMSLVLGVEEAVMNVFINSLCIGFGTYLVRSVWKNRSDLTFSHA